MTEQSQTPEPKALTLAQIAKLVKRRLPIIDKQTKRQAIKDGQLQFREVPIRAADIYEHREYDNHVVVVTVDGQKLRGNK